MEIKGTAGAIHINPMEEEGYEDQKPKEKTYIRGRFS